MNRRSLFVTLLAVAGFVALLMMTRSLAQSADPPLATVKATPTSTVQQITLSGLRQRRDLPPIGVMREQGVDDGVRAATAVNGVSGTSQCDGGIDVDGEVRGAPVVGSAANDLCYNSDLDVYTQDGRTYAVQAGGWDAAWTHYDVTDPANPVQLYQFAWDRRSYTPDIKAFRQGERRYLAASLERFSTSGYCGIVIYDITEPTEFTRVSQNDAEDWCDVHNIFVETDENGDGAWIYLIADATADIRVLDIGGGLESGGSEGGGTGNGSAGSVESPVEVGRYGVPGAGYVHDITVVDHTEASGGAVGRRVYISYWREGLVILEAAAVTPGLQPTAVVGPRIIQTDGFRTHHAVASADGRFVFVQDEFLNAAGAQPVQMWDVAEPSAPRLVDVLVLGEDTPVNPAHNLEIRHDIAPNRLFAGWYRLGLQAWDFNDGGFIRAHAQPRTAALYHQAQTDGGDSVYSGDWAVRVLEISTEISTETSVGNVTNTYALQSDRQYGLIVNCLTCDAVPDLMPTPEPTPTSTAVTTGTLTPIATLVVTETPVAPATLAPTETPLPTPSPTITPRLIAEQSAVLYADADEDGRFSAGDVVRVDTAITNSTGLTLTNVAFSQTLTNSVTLVQDSVQVSANLADNAGGVQEASERALAVSLGNLAPQAAITIDYLLAINVPPSEIVTRTETTTETRLVTATVGITDPLVVTDTVVVTTTQVVTEAVPGESPAAIPLQGIVTSANWPNQPTDDPTTPASGDATVLRLLGPMDKRLYLPVVAGESSVGDDE